MVELVDIEITINDGRHHEGTTLNVLRLQSGNKKIRGEASFPIQVHSAAIINIEASFIVLFKPLRELHQLCQTSKKRFISIT
jgi:hypothetical protein